MKRGYYIVRDFFYYHLQEPVQIGFVIFIILLLFIGGLYAAGLILWLKEVIVVWERAFDPVFSLGTLFVALAVWFGERREAWKADLPKKFTTIFKYHKREVMRCERAELSGEADMRALGQQIGLQMLDVTRLPLNAPGIKFSGGDPTVGEAGNVYRHYCIEIILQTLPSELEKSIGSEGTESLVWLPPFNERPKVLPSVHSEL